MPSRYFWGPIHYAHYVNSGKGSCSGPKGRLSSKDGSLPCRLGWQWKREREAAFQIRGGRSFFCIVSKFISCEQSSPIQNHECPLSTVSARTSSSSFMQVSSRKMYNRTTAVIWLRCLWTYKITNTECLLIFHMKLLSGSSRVHHLVAMMLSKYRGGIPFDRRCIGECRCEHVSLKGTGSCPIRCWAEASLADTNTKESLSSSSSLRSMIFRIINGNNGCSTRGKSFKGIICPLHSYFTKNI